MTPVRIAAILKAILAAAVFAAPLSAQASNTDDVRNAELPESHLSGAGIHKLFVLADDASAMTRLGELGAVERTIDYGSFRLVFVNDDGLSALSEPALARVVLRDDLDLIGINGWNIDSRVGEPRDVAASRRQQPALYDRQLYVVQFVGPMREDWMDRLTRRSDVQVVAYLPNDAYVVFATRAAWAHIATFPQHPRSPVQWAGVYHPAYRISPYLDAAIARGDGSVDVVVELVEHPGTDATETQIVRRALGTIAEPMSLGGLRDLRLTIPAAALESIATEPDVFWIEPCLPKRKLDERQGQIMAGNLDGTGTQPSAPGYLAFLNGKGFTSNFPFSVDVADDGFDRGSTSDVHQDFKDASNVSRASYVLNYSTDPSGDGGGGHGTINAAIVGGFNDTQGNSAFEDAGGYQYGLGIAPYVLLGHTKLFNNAGSFTSTSYATMIQNAYNAGARISSNSWGLTGLPAANRYTTDSRQYDILVRDAASGTAGNQEMSIVFAAGNSGSGANSVTAPGTGKNVFTIGASENFRQTGTDGCGITNSGADNAKDIISFSSRGPCSDGRIKPDIMAPGTHIQGAQSRSANFNGASVCDPNFPAGQSVYCWSSGTSHSTPAIAGSCALVRQYFVNQGWGAPSPAMTKAYLMSTTAYMTGVGGSGTLPSNAQGLGRVDLGRAFDGTANVRVDESTVFATTGDTFTTSGTIADSSKPFRVVLAWTDPPGTVNANAWVNNLDLEVTVNGTLFKGNVFSGATSITGGTADTRNNSEAVFLASGTSGSWSITVRATNIAGDGVPGNADTTDQDFALFVYNGSVGSCTDLTPPVITCPANQTREATSPSGAVVSFTATATDDCTANPTISCVPASGSTFAIATTTVNCTATDNASRTASCSFTVTVRDTTAPTITCSANLTRECTSASGANVSFTTTATDVADASPTVNCSPSSGSLFPFGTTTVTCTASDHATPPNTSAPCSFTVTVRDTTAPSITCSSNLTAECTSPSGAAVGYVVTTTDACDASPSLNCAPASGSTFGFGTTTVNCTATDHAVPANSRSCSFTVTVRDTTGPTITCPANISTACTSTAGAVVTYSTTATDTCDASPTVSCAPASGSSFAVGTTTVNCSASDHASPVNTRTCSFTVTVTDTTAPTITCPANITAEATSASGAAVSFTTTASDACDANPTVSCAPASGSTFAIATTTVNCTASDHASPPNTRTCSFTVTVQDTTAPTLSCAANITAEATSA
ncbi:MAG: HYR domain-containing protein, partial [Planctomycetes bacterium]|nr:HYR domain-containing protein [Planctomycetota bacterium]